MHNTDRWRNEKKQVIYKHIYRQNCPDVFSTVSKTRSVVIFLWQSDYITSAEEFSSIQRQVAAINLEMTSLPCHVIGSHFRLVIYCQMSPGVSPTRHCYSVRERWRRSVIYCYSRAFHPLRKYAVWQYPAEKIGTSW